MLNVRAQKRFIRDVVLGKVIRSLLRNRVGIRSLCIPASWPWWNGYVSRSDLPSALPVAQSLVSTRESRDQIFVYSSVLV